MDKRRVITIFVIALALAALVYFQFQHWKQFNWHQFTSQTAGVNWWAILGAIGLIYATYVLRAVRWAIFLRPVCRVRADKLIPPTFIGFTGLALLGRPGEFIRPYLIARKTELTVSSQAGVWAVERIFDIGAFTLLLTADIFISSELHGFPYYSQFRKAGFALIALVILLAFGAFMMKRRGAGISAWIERWLGVISPNFGRHAGSKARAFGEGLNTIQDLSSFLQLVGVSLAIWWLIALAYRTVAHAYPLIPHVASERALHRLDVPEVLLLMGLSMVGSLVQLPAVGGGSQLAVISGLQGIFNVRPESAVSCGIMLWLVTFMTCIPVGLFFAHRGHLSLRRLSAESHAEEEREEEAEPLFAGANPHPSAKAPPEKAGDRERPPAGGQDPPS